MGLRLRVLGLGLRVFGVSGLRVLWVWGLGFGGFGVWGLAIRVSV